MKEINGKYMTKCWKYVILVNRKEQQTKKKKRMLCMIKMNLNDSTLL